MARNGGLNPASMPFFPGGIRPSDDISSSGFGFRHNVVREQDRTSLSSLSISSDRRSVKSSPSPPTEAREASPHGQRSPEREWLRRSPAVHQVGPMVESKAKESSTLGILDTLAEGDDNLDTPGLPCNEVQSGTSFFALQKGSPDYSTPIVNMNHGGFVDSARVTSASPVSSSDSASHFSTDRQSLSFETQLKSSPMLHNIVERLIRCEYSTREIQRDLSDMHRKVDLLVGRSLGVNSQPEFKDPFAPPNTNGFSISPPLPNGPRPSIGNIAPNQSVPPDDITMISQRLDTLSSSVGQLLTLQTQHPQPPNTESRSNSIIGSSPQQGDIAQNQIFPPPALSSMLSNGLPHRSDMRNSPRPSHPPTRTWSAGTLDLPMRPSDPNVGRQDPMIRDKRRSVSGLLRRESSGMVDPQTDSWALGSPRDSGPIISKWEQLPLAPDLLRSLNKFGVGPPNKIQQRALPFLLRGSDIIAQAPPTQERIAAYVIPAIQVAVTNITARSPNRGPIVIMISTTVDQATQAQRMIRDLGGPIGVRSALGVGTTSASSDLSQELRLLHQNMPHIICGTPQKLHALFTSPSGLLGSEVRFLVLDEVDQLIARNLHEFVFNIVKLLPPPRSRPLPSSAPTTIQQATFPGSPDPGNSVLPPFQTQGRRFSIAAPSPTPPEAVGGPSQPLERQTALFSNTVPQDVLNLASAIQLREPVRVLVRRDGNVTHADTNQGSRGLRQFYLYLAFTAGGRSEPMAVPPGGGLGIIGSGRSASTAESAQAREWKLDALADLFDDVEVTQAIVHVGGVASLDTVVYKLASRGLEAVPLHGDMNAGTKLAALNKFRNSNSAIMRQPATKVLVVYDVQVKPPEVSHIPLIVNYDLPKAVEEYAHRVSPAIASNYSRAGVVVNFVTATGGDVEMLRSIECFYKIKCPEVPTSLRDII